MRINAKRYILYDFEKTPFAAYAVEQKLISRVRNTRVFIRVHIYKRIPINIYIYVCKWYTLLYTPIRPVRVFLCGDIPTNWIIITKQTVNWCHCSLCKTSLFLVASRCAYYNTIFMRRLCRKRQFSVDRWILCASSNQQVDARIANTFEVILASSAPL